MAIPKGAPACAPSASARAAAGPPEEDEEVLRQRRRRRMTDIRNVIIGSICYFGFGIGYFCTRADKACASGEDGCYERWNVIDSIYFSTVTMTTVGYGDLKPLNMENRVITIFYILFGMIVSGTPRRARGSLRFSTSSTLKRTDTLALALVLARRSPPHSSRRPSPPLPLTSPTSPRIDRSSFRRSRSPSPPSSSGSS